MRKLCLSAAGLLSMTLLIASVSLLVARVFHKAVEQQVKEVLRDYFQSMLYEPGDTDRVRLDWQDFAQKQLLLCKNLPAVYTGPLNLRKSTDFVMYKSSASCGNTFTLPLGKKPSCARILAREGQCRQGRIVWRKKAPTAKMAVGAFLCKIASGLAKDAFAQKHFLRRSILANLDALLRKYF